MSILDSIFGKSQNPMDAANPYLEQIPGMVNDYYGSYRNSGLDASGKTKNTYESLMNDPNGFINSLMKGYKPSEGYQFQKDLLGKEMSNTAAAGGVAGTNLDQMNQAQGIQGLLGKDMQQYLQNALNIFGTGLQGEEGIATRGYDATGRISDTQGNALNQKAGLAFQNAQQNNSNRSAMIQALVKALGTAAGSIFGPAGAALGGGLGGGLAGPMSGSSTPNWTNPDWSQ